MRFGQAVLTKCQIADDFTSIVATIVDPAKRREHLSLEGLSATARDCLADLSQEDGYLKFLDQDFARVHAAFTERPPEQWSRYEIFEKSLLPKEPAAPQDTPSDVTMAEPSSATIDAATLEDEKLYFNLQALYDQSVPNAVAILNPVIYGLHAPCAKSAALLGDEQLAEFFSTKYGI